MTGIRPTPLFLSPLRLPVVSLSHLSSLPQSSQSSLSHRCHLAVIYLSSPSSFGTLVVVYLLFPLLVYGNPSLKVAQLSPSSLYPSP